MSKIEIKKTKYGHRVYGKCEVCRTPTSLCKANYRGWIYCSPECAKIGHYKKVSAAKLSNRKTIVKRCELCHEKFKVMFGKMARKFCSRKCYIKSRPRTNPTVKKYCTWCEKKFKVLRYRKDKAKFCSPECFQMSHASVLQKVRSQSESPNKSEKYLLTVLQYFDFKFVGDGKLFIGGKNPDFVHRKRKLLVELFGEHWHTEKDVSNRRKIFEKRGYKLLVIWCKELKHRRKLFAIVSSFVNSK